MSATMTFKLAGHSVIGPSGVADQSWVCTSSRMPGLPLAREAGAAAFAAAAGVGDVVGIVRVISFD